MQKNVLITTFLVIVTMTCSACGSSVFFGMHPTNGETGEKDAKALATTSIGCVFQNTGKLSELECKYFNNAKLVDEDQEYEAYWTLGFRNDSSDDYEVLVDAVTGKIMQMSRCPSDQFCAELNRRKQSKEVVIEDNEVSMTAGVGNILSKPMVGGSKEVVPKKVKDLAEDQERWKSYAEVGRKVFETMGYAVSDAYCTTLRNEEVVLRDAEGTRHKKDIPCINVVVIMEDGQVGDICLTEEDMKVLIIHMDRGRIKL